MTRRLRSVIVASVLATASVAAHGQSLIITGGANVPVSELSDIADIGYHVSAGLNLNIPATPIAFRFEGAYDGLGLKNGSGNVRIISGTANAVLSLSKQPDSPYFIGGVGAYNRTFDSTSAGNYGNGLTVLGINAGAGLRVPLSGISTFLEARYHIMLGNHTDGTNYQFTPITFDLMF